MVAVHLAAALLSVLVGALVLARRKGTRSHKLFGRLWIGLVENSGGAQVEYSLIPERLWLSFEAYDFSRELDLDPHLRLSTLWYPWRNLFVEAGYDDPLVDELRSPFVGFGLRWSDDDIKYLLGSVPDF